VKWLKNFEKFSQKICAHFVKLKCSQDFNTMMDANSLNISRFKAQCNKFSGIISKGLSKPEQKFFKQVIYGIQASKDVKISNICRSLNEPIKLIKTEERLCRHFAKKDYTQFINKQILRLGDDKITEDMVIAIDPGDIRKPYAKEMEKLCGIWDGSQSQKAIGYHLCQVTGANLEHNKIVPLYCEAYSSEEEGYTNSTDKLKSIIGLVKSNIGTCGTWAIDRAGDNAELIKYFEDENLNFVTRLKQTRWLVFKNRKGKEITIQAERVDRHIDLPFKATITKIADGKEEKLIIEYGMVEVAFEKSPDHKFNAVIIRGFGKIPMVLITNKKVNPNDSKEVYRIVEIYLTRWKCDECYRYIKQSYNLEDVRLLSLNGIKNITVFVHAIAYFTSIFLGVKLKLKVMVEKIFILSKRFFGVPSFFNYAMADGIYQLLKFSKAGVEVDYKGKTGSSYNKFQLSLGFT
jgi:hypothetical protein